MANGHLQRDEPAVTVAEHDCFARPCAFLHNLGHPVGDIRKTSADRLDRPKPGNSGTITRNDCDKRGTTASKLARSDSSE